MYHWEKEVYHCLVIVLEQRSSCLGDLQLLEVENLSGSTNEPCEHFLCQFLKKDLALLSIISMQALKKAGIQILEPLMSLEITVSEDHLSAALADLAQRRGSIQEIQSRQDNKVVIAAVPLAEMMVRNCYNA